MEAHRVQDEPPLHEPAARPVAPARHDHDRHNHHPEADASPLAHDADALFSARSLWLTRSGRAILQGVDIDIAQGEDHCARLLRTSPRAHESGPGKTG